MYTTPHTQRTSRRLRTSRSRLLLGLVLALASCSHRVKVQIPPRVDLRGWDTIGLIQIDTQGPSDAGPYATSNLMQAIQRAQPGVPLLELGSERAVLREVGRDRLDFEAVRAIGSRYGVQAVFLGHLELTRVKPSIRISPSLKSLRADARIEGRLETKLMRTDSGATLWTGGSHDSRSIAALKANRRGPVDFGLGDFDAAQAQLVQSLVQAAIRDLCPTWEWR